MNRGSSRPSPPRCHLSCPDQVDPGMNGLGLQTSTMHGSACKTLPPRALLRETLPRPDSLTRPPQGHRPRPLPSPPIASRSREGILLHARLHPARRPSRRHTLRRRGGGVGRQISAGDWSPAVGSCRHCMSPACIPDVPRSVLVMPAEKHSLPCAPPPDSSFHSHSGLATCRLTWTPSFKRESCGLATRSLWAHNLVAAWTTAPPTLLASSPGDFRNSRET